MGLIHLPSLPLPLLITFPGLPMLRAYLLQRITIIHKTRGGLSDARNEGIKKAIADWILPLDADDILDPNFLLSAVSATKEYADSLLRLSPLPSPFSPSLFAFLPFPHLFSSHVLFFKILMIIAVFLKLIW